MRFFGQLALALIAATALAGGPVSAATCQADNLTCPTAMPEGGFCQCTSHGTTHDGEVVASPAPHRHQNARAGGCGAHPEAPGCR